MPDRRSHRGPHPQDAELFAAAAVPRLQQATADLDWLLSRGYAHASALKLVGDRYDLTVRQRVAVARCACSEGQLQRRTAHRLAPESVAGCAVWLDGYNVLTTVEAALSGGALLLARDETLRDMASMHGSYRKVEETRPALERIALTLTAWKVAECRWYLDRPVSNSGRLKGIIDALAAEHGWPWQVELVANPDRELSATEQIVATADSVILDCCQKWLNLGREVVTRHVPQAWIVALPGGVKRSRQPELWWRRDY